MGKRSFIKIDIHNQGHCEALIRLLNDYMEDDMGKGESMPEALAPKIIEGLKKHKAYLGFLVKHGEDYAALANCNLNYSTWQACFLVNIHDLIVAPAYRGQGIGEYLLKGIEHYAKEKGYCKLNLEVREDNINAQGLYQKLGFSSGDNPMLFWQKSI